MRIQVLDNTHYPAKCLEKMPSDETFMSIVAAEQHQVY
ncbi:hypothetical protein DFP81_105121 [Marinomonas pollencensis]|uniref:Uncharacterized protein n=1 Tax=Marinomonas pollencensis TaxID=491954 RepID=A0A3E0DPI0_9GAMM|nr:hypothetical protein DFP81_105121 [Marinomonas pollencensis]